MKLQSKGWNNNGKSALHTEGLHFLSLDVDPKKLTVNPDNPYKELKSEDYERLKADIKERGIIDPLIIDQENILLTGHNRLAIALELDLKTVPVRKLVSEITPDEKYKIMLLDNLNRRQLTPAEKIEFIRMAYGKELEKDNRGGDRKSKPPHDGFDNSKPAEKKTNTVKKISEETGFSEKTVERAVKKIKGKSKPPHDGFDNSKPAEKKTPKLTLKREKELSEIRSGECRFREDGVLDSVYQIRKDKTAQSGYSLFREYEYQGSIQKIGQIVEMNDEGFTYELRSLGFCQNVTVKFSKLYKKVNLFSGKG